MKTRQLEDIMDKRFRNYKGEFENETHKESKEIRRENFNTYIMLMEKYKRDENVNIPYGWKTNNTNQEVETSTNQNIEKNTNLRVENTTNQRIENNTNLRVETYTNQRIETNTNLRVETFTNQRIETNTNLRVENNTNHMIENYTNRWVENDTNMDDK